MSLDAPRLAGGPDGFENKPVLSDCGDRRPDADSQSIPKRRAEQDQIPALRYDRGDLGKPQLIASPTNGLVDAAPSELSQRPVGLPAGVVLSPEPLRDVLPRHRQHDVAGPQAAVVRAPDERARLGLDDFSCEDCRPIVYTHECARLWRLILFPK
jgi:hypothetical protein